ncbi:Zn-dependent hydrolase [Niallia sp. NCCP-28]|uniref:Zn-dependent hydrolase n=1 Tax=Niallia sp. NCCP-28 TaxID=2934712 RepID=UPI002087B922|nr:Zn-dependent hydrolase [Niallia sp. NCCP-28]GKU83485.1 Zn-dependent hydrolase [Niallia sp. NCCP-28]
MEGQKLLINGERLKESLERFADFGRTKNNGVTRLSLSEEDMGVREYFRSCCEEIGMSVAVDDMGCMYATLAGKEEKLPIVMGSHLDTVKKGGRFDGVLGVAAGLEVARTLVENNMQLRYPLMIVNYTNEEGARFEPSMMASGVLSGKFDKEEMLEKKDANGITLKEALEKSGYAGDIEARLKKAAAFLELHIEQGPVLERESLTIGIVECVVGMVCYEITLTGESDHAGTTPMGMRKDALFAANNVISAFRSKLSQLDENLVYTMGRMNIFPNIHTVIPNKVVFTIEARHKSPVIIKEVEEIILEIKSFAYLEGCTIEVNKQWDRKTVWFDEKLLESVEKSVNGLGYSYKKIASGAGHDAQFIASIAPTAMLFVPSLNGKSHCEEEFTAWEDCEKGVNVMLETVLDIDKR